MGILGYSVMSEIELKELFTPEEYELLLEFMILHDYLWSKNICYTEYIQEFLTTLDDNERKEEIIYLCIQKYPQILGLKESL